MHKGYIAAPVIAAALVFSMGNTGCQSAGSTTSGSRGGPIIFYGPLPAEGTWESLGTAHSGTHAGQHAWLELGTAAITGAVAGAAAANEAAKAVGTAHAEAAVAAPPEDPCKDQNSGHRIATWVTRTVKFFNPAGGMNSGWITCGRLREMLKGYRTSTPQDILNCIGHMIKKGKLETRQGDLIAVFHYRDGAAAFNSAGQLLSAWPPPGGWAKCGG